MKGRGGIDVSIEMGVFIVESGNSIMLKRSATILSPLRYPGSKRGLASYIAETLRLNSLFPKLLVEPFAGGASVSLQLLNDGLVDRVALGEKDPLLASFWKIVFNNCDSLIQEVSDVDVTVDNWRHFRHAKPRTDLSRALACLFLNRTNYSGILKRDAGPIGGFSQKSRYKINCRFPKATIIKRLRQAANLRDKVLFVNYGDWRATLDRAIASGYETSEIFAYLDPPFFRTGNRLYEQAFRLEDHSELCRYLSKAQIPWLLSYDPAEPIVEMYSENGITPKRISLLYSAKPKSQGREARELVITNLPNLPSQTQLWKTSSESARTSKPH